MDLNSKCFLLEISKYVNWCIKILAFLRNFKDLESQQQWKFQRFWPYAGMASNPYNSLHYIIFFCLLNFHILTYQILMIWINYEKLALKWWL